MSIFADVNVVLLAADMEPVEEEFDLADVLGEDVGGSGSKEDLLKQAELELQVGTLVLAVGALHIPGVVPQLSSRL